MKLNTLFSDGAVFQRRRPIPVFGIAAPSAVLELEFNGKVCRGLTSQDGSFLVRMPAQEAGGPYTLTIRDLTTGDSAEVKNILVGEVWLASGQSNMEFMLNSSPAQMADFAAETADTDTIRVFTVPRTAMGSLENDIMPNPALVDGNPEWILEQMPKWVNVQKENLPKISAVSAWFARKLRDELNVPVGMVVSSWGGTIVEAWTSWETLCANPDHGAAAQDYLMKYSTNLRWEQVAPANPLDNSTSAPAVENLLLERYCIKNPPMAPGAEPWAMPEFNDFSWTDFSIPDSWVAKNLGGNGVAWIRCAVELPESWAGRDIDLCMGGIDKHDTTFFNGGKVGETGKDFECQHYDTPRRYRVPGNLVKAGKNVIAVRAFSFIYDGALLGNPEQYYVELADTKEQIGFAGACKFKMENDFGRLTFPAEAQTLAMGPRNPNSFGILFNSMIRPLIPYGIRGAIWYQGESNAGDTLRAQRYALALADMIRDWRFRWCQGDFPFIQMGLAGYTAELDYQDNDAWAYLRESQRQVLHMLPNVGMASAVDAGEISDIHPKDKRKPAERMADWALEHTYHAGVRGTSPDIIRAEREGTDKIRLCFTESADGLEARNGGLKGFYVSGAVKDSRYFPAEAVIDGNTVVLTVPEKLDKAVVVRYAWSVNPMAVLTLYNRAGYPAHPFEIVIK